MPHTLKLKVTESDTEPVREERNLVELMREAVDGSGSFMSRRAQQILWDRFRIAVVVSAGIYTAKASHISIMLERISGVLTA